MGKPEVQTKPEEAIWKYMERGRYLELTKSGARLTEEESKDWHYCASWEGLLIHRKDPTFTICSCGFKQGVFCAERDNG